jgi:hypothetical protein
MLGRIFAAAIIGFWLVMMTMLIRSELLETSSLAYSVPVETVMQKMFEGEEPSDLVIDYNGARVGHCSLQVTKDRKSPTPRYSVMTELLLDFEVFGRSVRMQSRTDSEFDNKYQMTKFTSRTTTGDSQLEASGDFTSKEVQLAFKLGDVVEKHKLPFSMLENMGPSGAMGLFGMSGMQLPQGGNAEFAKSALSALDTKNRGPVTTVQEKSLMLGHGREQALMVYTKYDESLWTKMYVNRLGEVLKVETSFGVTMLNSQFAPPTKN